TAGADRPRPESSPGPADQGHPPGRGAEAGPGGDQAPEGEEPRKRVNAEDDPGHDCQVRKAAQRDDREERVRRAPGGDRQRQAALPAERGRYPGSARGSGGGEREDSGTGEGGAAGQG